MNACVHLVEETIREPLQQYQDERLRSIFEEMKNLYDSNKMDVQSAIEGSPELFTIIQDRHCSILRMKRCVIAYLYHRLKEIERLRWTTGGVLPMDVRENLSEMEIEWFQNYSRNLTFYMGSVDPDGFLDLTQNMQPPENLYVRVKCLEEYGDFSTESGTTYTLTKGSVHFIPRHECEVLVLQGVLAYLHRINRSADNSV
ncbi:hypothetical protein M514_00127 [Trichuris suis]|uniref:DNA replication complex GINS protein PSF1 n=1 Tax=Trichuris suis TaxID=68888 RepID=A0A085NU47_9BILA|nr:hypothetical protein M514_00127 [Trichuris suis]